MYLMNDLPVPILADISMLRAFGYKFKDETPPFFAHPSEPDLDFDLKEDEEIYKVNTHKVDWFKRYHDTKINCIQYKDDKMIINEPDSMHDSIKANGKLVYHHLEGSLIAESNKETEVKRSEDHVNKIKIGSLALADNEPVVHLLQNYEGCHEIHSVQLNGYKTFNQLYIDPDNINEDNLIPLDVEYHQVNTLLQNVNTKGDTYETNNKYHHPGVDRFGASMSNAPIYHNCLFIMAKQAFLASEEEIKRARKAHKNEKLKWNKFDYLKGYEDRYGARFKGLYEAIKKCIEEFKDVFATHVFSRVTMKVPPARLGIRPEYRHKTMYAPQYPINEIKRGYMINYTEENVKNGFWHKIKHSLHCVPYTMVPKKRHGVILRYRPAFDGRPVNKYCELMDSNMPTLKDFDDLHSIKGFSTMADVKNCFDCIPLHKDDQKYAVAMTPLGLFQMTCLTYGWMNAAPNAQRIMNQLAIHVTYTLAYIDDICTYADYLNSVEIKILN